MLDDLINLELFRATPLTRAPFDHLIVPGFLSPGAARAVAASFPGPDLPGVLPAPAGGSADAFGRLMEGLRSTETTRAFGAKFGVDLDPATLMVTLRARTRLGDGAIHTDSETKIVTALIYLNEDWSSEGGRLRLLRGPHDIDDMIAEVPPVAGTLLAFRRTGNSWHGHKPFSGVRRSIMLNWMTDPATMRRELRRHALSVGVKSLFNRR
jgi:hypothetical protein